MSGAALWGRVGACRCAPVQTGLCPRPSAYACAGEPHVGRSSDSIPLTRSQMFMTEEFVAGKSLLGGEYLLPTGVALPFGAMVDKLSRDRLMQEIMTVGGEGGGRGEVVAC